MVENNYRQAFKSALARIHAKTSAVVGAGFLVADRQLLTCAHVVTAALGLPTTTQEAPTDWIDLDFPLTAPGQKVKAKVTFWRPVQLQPLTSPEEGEDIAGLKLEVPPPKGCQPVRLVSSSELWAHAFQIFGFPTQRDEGIWASGVIRDRLASGWVQIEDIKAQGHPVQPGFSGAPIWDEQVEGVVGMAVAADKKRDETKTAFMIPTSILTRAWGELGQFVQLPDAPKPDLENQIMKDFFITAFPRAAASNKPSALSKALQLKIELIKKRLAQKAERHTNLNQQYDALLKELNDESNAANKNEKERQLKSIDKDIITNIEAHAKLEAELQKIEASGVLLDVKSTTPAVNPKIQKLLDILLPHEQEIINFAGKGFSLCRSDGWELSQPETLKELLLEFENMPLDTNNRSALAKFAGFLAIHSQTPQALIQPLANWGREQIPDFTTLQSQMEQLLTVQVVKQQEARSYLLIRVDQRKVKSNEYFVKGYIIPDEQAYNHNTGEGSVLLNNAIADRETFKLIELASLTQGYIEQCNRYCPKDLTVEVFLPLPLLNEAVDIWERQEFDVSTRIGQEYSIVVRSIERLKNYSHSSEWEDKWETLRVKMDNYGCDLFIDGDCDLGTLLFKLGQPDAVALKLAKTPEQTGVESVFVALLKTATPIALWVRRNLPSLPYQTSEFNSLLKYCIKELPHRVKLKRRETLLPDKRQEDNHIGHHLALIWEDPKRLPPSDIEYSPPGL